MSKSLCMCGRIVERKYCPACDKRELRVHSKRHDAFSRGYRRDFPLCEACVYEQGVLTAKLSRDTHHIVKVVDAPSLAFDESNVLALCRRHHDYLESRPDEARQIKAWSIGRYAEAMGGA